MDNPIERISQCIDRYLRGKISAKRAAKRLERIIRTEGDRGLDEEAREALRALLSLLGGPDTASAPSREDLEAHRDVLRQLTMERISQCIDRYLRGEISAKHAAKWAGHFMGRDLDRGLGEEAREALCALMSLDDGPDTAWSPSQEELESHRDVLHQLAAKRKGEGD